MSLHYSRFFVIVRKLRRNVVLTLQNLAQLVRIEDKEAEVKHGPGRGDDGARAAREALEGAREEPPGGPRRGPPKE